MGTVELSRDVGVFFYIFIQSFFSLESSKCFECCLVYLYCPQLFVDLADRPISHTPVGRSCFVSIVTEEGTRLVKLCCHGNTLVERCFGYVDG